MRQNKISILGYLILIAFGVMVTPLSSGSENAEKNVTISTEFDLVFPGGSALDLQGVVIAKGVNLLLPKNADEIEIPPFSVKNVTALELFTALNLLLSDTDAERFAQFKQGRSGIRRSGIWALVWTLQQESSTQMEMEREATQEIVRMQVEAKRRELEIQKREMEAMAELRERQRELELSHHREHKNNEATRDKRMTYPVNISSLLESLTMDQISSVIHAAVSAAANDEGLDAEEAAPTLSFHKDTKMLIVTGPERSVTIALTTIDQLHKSRKGF